MTYTASKSSKDKALGKNMSRLQSGFQLTLVAFQQDSELPACLCRWMLKNFTNETLNICVWWEGKARKGRETYVLKCSWSNFKSHCGTHQKKQQLCP